MSKICVLNLLGILSTHSLREPLILFLLKSVSKLFYEDGTGDPNILQVYMKKKQGVENISIDLFEGIVLL